jgi:hypothetical protein
MHGGNRGHNWYSKIVRFQGSPQSTIQFYRWLDKPQWLTACANCNDQRIEPSLNFAAAWSHFQLWPCYCVVFLAVRSFTWSVAIPTSIWGGASAESCSGSEDPSEEHPTLSFHPSETLKSKITESTSLFGPALQNCGNFSRHEEDLPLPWKLRKSNRNKHAIVARQVHIGLHLLHPCIFST